MTGAEEPRRARLARPGELSCLETEGVTGINCACPQGHGGPHRGWYRPAGDDTGEYSLVVVWPVPEQPALVEPEGLDRLLARIDRAVSEPPRGATQVSTRDMLDEAQAMIRRMRVGMNPHGLELSYMEGERDNLREVVAEAQRVRDDALRQVAELREVLESDRAAARRLDADRVEQIRELRARRHNLAVGVANLNGQLLAIGSELHESVRGDGAPESATLADRVAAMRMAYVHRHNLAESLHGQVKAVRALAPPLSDASPGTLAERVQARIDAARTERFAMLHGSIRRHQAFRARALERERALKRIVHEHEVGPRLPTSGVPTDTIREVLGWPQWPTRLFDDADNETEPPSPSASTLLALVREALVDADAMGRGVAPEDVPAVVAGVLEELSRLRAATADGVPVGTTPELPSDGERAVQCNSLYVSRGGGAAACQLLLDHHGLHIAANGCAWADETMSPENVAAPRPRLDQRPSCPVCGESSPDHEVDECDDTSPRVVGGVRSDPGRAYRPDQTVTVRLDDATVRAIERTIARAARRG